MKNIEAIIAQHHNSIQQLSARLDQLQAGLRHLTEKVNRVEANAAHMKSAHPSPAHERVDNAIALLDRATEVFAKQTEEFQRMKDDLRNGR